jgi:predicted esterase
VLLTHGRVDPLLPYAGSVALQELLAEAGLRVDFRPFDGAHTIGPEGLAALGALIREIGPR